MMITRIEARRADALKLTARPLIFIDLLRLSLVYRDPRPARMDKEIPPEELLASLEYGWIGFSSTDPLIDPGIIPHPVRLGENTPYIN
ncbi:MAG: hypothetical protein QXI22_00095 [Sulfolobales archaeon]